MAAAAGGPPTVLDIDSDIEELGGSFEVDIEGELAEEEGLDGEEDPERMPRETEPFPALHPPAKASLTSAGAKAAAKIRQETEKDANTLLEEGNVPGAIALYTEAMRACGATAMLLATRAALLLRQRRPCAAVRDCTAALRVNASMVKAYRIRGTAHRKLGHWRKASRDLSEAQGLKFDAATAELQRFVAAQVLKLDIAAERRRHPGGTGAGGAAAPPAKEQQATAAQSTPGPQGGRPAEQVSGEQLMDLDKGQAVVQCGLQKAPHLNGRRGVVERSDPRPAARGRWEVELRMDGGKLEVKSLKRENIMTLNKADKAACRAWASEEKRHREERRQREEREEQAQYRRCVEAKLAKLKIEDRTRKLLRELHPKEALDLLDKVGDTSVVASVNDFLASQARLFLGQSDSDEEANAAGKRAYDPEEEPPLKAQKTA